MTRGPNTIRAAGKARYPRIKLAQTIIPRRPGCECEPGQCQKAARECKDWIKRATNRSDNKGAA